MAHTKRLKPAWQIAVAKSIGFKPVSNQATKQALRILVAENNPINQKVLACLLQPTGCQIDFVDNGLDDIAAGAKEKFQAAGMNGFVEKPIDTELLFKTIEEHTGTPLTRPDFV